ncbi:SUMF1/EgtB/PvdO family nonheme iron enzyme [Phototrophicus methaneseepsis]|uniref:SUMF1/EgtB/PvdO family nonheme iron enzyme n=1 Tax=Phototrophicus methaneseepsis TaxID=2710758 RepID=A0A7S8IED7_9CHLR|nr:SUMF1/EgtB/PvdO family nonheme iron enzyme [Phototrophicus methaneseepsis]QPC81718.1 SUMF1/EgtB/PvdO family nonheme iron enzyme [Phototrophicus methaneseepsis]
MNALTTPNKTLFLSYSRRQTTWCNDLYTAIDTYTHFYRWRDNKIPESADWWDSICLNIEGCYAFVAILSQDYLDSVYCMGELEYALKLNKPIIALMLHDVDYPQQLNEQRLQFARVNDLQMPQVINKILSACNQITLGYMQDAYSTDIHPRQHLRPRVPTPKASTPTPEEDAILNKQIDEVTVHGQIPTRDLMRRYNEEKNRNIRLARDLLDKIAQRQDVPIFFDVDEENKELSVAEKRFAEEERQRQRIKQVSGEYDDLAHYVSTARPQSAMKAIKRFIEAYPEFGDPQDLMAKFRPTSKSLMPAPFDWIEIPGKSYSIAKYPITNAQFAKFIEAGGYSTERWWTQAGWAQREKGSLTEPRYWTDSKWNGAEQPVVGVSWFEAVAFCLWLSETTGENIMLPTEDQWQYAAQGDDGRDYPWGNDWDCKRCNNSVKPCNSKVTTPVRHYEGKGDSPFGVVDMAGNVWEWCLTDYDNETNDINSDATDRVLRGGSWYDDITGYFRCDCRNQYYPRLTNGDRGFRLSRFN